MHACRLKAGFPTIFEIRSAKSEVKVFKNHMCQVYLCLKIICDNLHRRLFYIHLHA